VLTHDLVTGKPLPVAMQRTISMQARGGAGAGGGSATGGVGSPDVLVGLRRAAEVAERAGRHSSASSAAASASSSPGEAARVAICSVCADPEQSQQLFLATCGHICCWSCWMKWLVQKSECPICRAGASKAQLIKLLIKR
jgi:hypothetical protein